MSLTELFALYGRPLKAEELKTFRFDVEALLKLGHIEKLPNSYPVFTLTEKGLNDNPLNQEFDAITKAAVAVSP